MTMSEDVEKFHAAAAPHSAMSVFRQTIGFPDIRMRTHVKALLTEEYEEQEVADADQSLPDLVDAYLDMIYVCFQGLLSTGLKAEEVDKLWAEVQRANMSKVAGELLAENDGKPYINDYGKITKPPGFRPPDIEGLLMEIRRGRG